MIDFSNDFIAYHGLSESSTLALSQFQYRGCPYLITLETTEASIHSLNRIYASLKGNSLFLNIHYVSNTLTHSVVSTLNTIALTDLMPLAVDEVYEPTLHKIYILDIFSYLLDPYHIYCYFFFVIAS